MVRKLLQHKNPFIFSSISQLYKGIVEKNEKVLEEEAQKVDYTAFKDLTRINTTLGYIERFYLRLEREIQQDPQLDLSQNFKKLKEKGEVNLYESPKPSPQPSLTGNIIDLQEVESIAVKPLEKLKSIWYSYVDYVHDKSPEQDEEYSKYPVFKVILLLLQTWLSYWEYFVYFMLIIYQVHNGGIIMVIIPFAVFAYALTEETRPVFKFWTFMFGYIVVVTLLRFTYIYLFGQDILSGPAAVSLLGLIILTLNS